MGRLSGLREFRLHAAFVPAVEESRVLFFPAPRLRGSTTWLRGTTKCLTHSRLHRRPRHHHHHHQLPLFLLQHLQTSISASTGWRASWPCLCVHRLCRSRQRRRHQRHPTRRRRHLRYRPHHSQFQYHSWRAVHLHRHYHRRRRHHSRRPRHCHHRYHSPCGTSSSGGRPQLHPFYSPCSHANV